MTQPSSLIDSLQQSIADRAREGMTIFTLDEPLSSDTPDFFSNDYLSLSTEPVRRNNFLRKVQSVPQTRLFGSTGSRVATGNSTEYNVLEKALERFFSSSSAILFGSGFSANMAFLGTVPRKGDVIISDELIHTSCREGIRLSSCAFHRFAHNSVASFEACLLDVLEKHPQVAQGSSTVFVVVESLYSMDGDFCPLTEIVDLVESLVPAGHAHIVVDEAHTSGICGPNGSGYVAHLGLNDRVHTKVHTFGKAWGFHGAVVLTSPIIRHYLINFAKSFVFTTSIPYTDIYALESCLDVISSTRGQELRKSLNCLSRYAREKLFVAFQNVPSTILALTTDDPIDTDTNVNAGSTVAASASASVVVFGHPDLYSPIIPVFTPHAQQLADYLLQKGYAVSPFTYPIVKRPRIRVIIHARNTEAEIDAFVHELVSWAVMEQPEREAREWEEQQQQSVARERGFERTRSGKLVGDSMSAVERNRWGSHDEGSDYADLPD